MVWSVTAVTSATGISWVDDGVVEAGAFSIGTTISFVSDVDGKVEVSTTLASVVKFSGAEVVVSFSAVSSGTTTGTRVSDVTGAVVDSAVAVC